MEKIPEFKKCGGFPKTGETAVFMGRKLWYNEKTGGGEKMDRFFQQVYGGILAFAVGGAHALAGDRDAGVRHPPAAGGHLVR